MKMSDFATDLNKIKPQIKELALEFRKREKAAEETNDAVMLHRAIRVRNRTLDSLREKFGFAVWHEFLTHYYDERMRHAKQRG